jgi:hypothetical protein
MLVRAGNAFSGYYSSDGVNWIQVGTTQTVALSGTALAGLAVTAHDNTALSTATFTNVMLAPAGGPSRTENRALLIEAAQCLSPPRQQGNDLSPTRERGTELCPLHLQGNDVNLTRERRVQSPPSLARRAKVSGGLRIFSMSLFLTGTVATIEG